jgi:hypothetical protein
MGAGFNLDREVYDSLIRLTRDVGKNSFVDRSFSTEMERNMGF